MQFFFFFFFFFKIKIRGVGQEDFSVEIDSSQDLLSLKKKLEEKLNIPR